MRQGAEKDTPATENYAATLVAANNGDGVPDSDEVRRPPTAAAHHASGRRDGTASSNGASISQLVVSFVERHPVVATGAALALGAAVAMAVQASKAGNGRSDRRLQRAARSMDRAFSREMRALRRSDVADRLGAFGSSLGDAFSRVDLSPLAEHGRAYLDAARRRLGA